MERRDSFFKRLLRGDRFTAAVGKLAARHADLVYATSAVIREPADGDARLLAGAPVIITLWHGQSFMLPRSRPRELKLKAMVAKHADGQIIGHMLREFGAELIHGAGARSHSRKKDKGGAGALMAALRALRGGVSVAMTADVPGRVSRQAGLGVVTLARLSGRPIIPHALASSRFVRLNTWSGLILNLPFSRVAVVTGEPIHVPRDASEAQMEEARLAVENGLNEAARRAFEIAGGKARRIAAAEENRAKPAPGFLLNAYAALTRALRPAAPYLLKRRSRKGKEIEARIGERMGEPGAARPAGPLWWFHAASVGETNAILPLMEALKRRRPALNILLTTVTVTSARIAAARLPAGAVHQFMPIDSPAFIANFLNHWRPDVALFTESEIWPNVILELDRRGTPIALLNARMSDRSHARWRRLRSMSRPLFSRFDLILTQTPRLAKRMEKLGARRVIAAGNLKFDAPPPPVNAAELARLEAAIGKRPVFLAASTHPGEDEIALAAHRRARAAIPGLLTIIAPRHPERGEAVAALAAAEGLVVARRSLGEEPGAQTEIYVADTIGELGIFYSMAPVAFIGGSLVRHGGQNPIEAVRLDCAVIAGPHHDNFKDAYRALEKCGGCRIVPDAGALGAAMLDLYAYPHAAQSMRERAERGIAALSGGLERTLDALAPYLPPAREALPAPAAPQENAVHAT